MDRLATLCVYVTGYWKSDQIVALGLFHFSGPPNCYTHTLPIHSAITRLGWLVCFSRANFTNPVNSRQTIGPMEGTTWRHGSEIDPSSSEKYLRLSERVGPMTGTSWLIASPNGPNRGFNPPPVAHPLRHTTRDITVPVKKLLKIQQC